MITSSSDKHFLHTSVVLRHANGDSGDAEQHIETILTEAAVAKRRVWVSSILFASPASGEFHRQTREEFTATVERLLAEDKTAAR